MAIAALTGRSLRFVRKKLHTHARIKYTH